MIQRKRIVKTISVAILFGIIHFFVFLNIPKDSLKLSIMVLGMSGGTMVPSVSRLLSFSLQLTPTFLFAAMLGTEFYQHFCIADVYVFSRQPRRTVWYTKETLQLLLLTFLYQCIFMAVSLICTLMWLPIEIDSSGVYLLVQHIGIYTLWLFGLVLLINTLSIILGSDYGYIISFATQILQIAMLYWPDDKTFNPISPFLPTAHLISFWHTSSVESVAQVLSPKYQMFSFAASFLMHGGSVLIIFLISLYVVKRFDIISPKETGGAT